jgi:hypothetical protein
MLDANKRSFNDWAGQSASKDLELLELLLPCLHLCVDESLLPDLLLE